MIRDVWSCQEEKWSKAKKISQGAAAATELRAAEGGGRRRWSRDLQVLRVTTQREVKSDETSAEFQGETSELENVFGPASSGHQEERRWSKSGRISAAELWGGRSGGASQEKRKHNGAEVQQLPKHTNGPQAKQTEPGWLIFQLCAALPSQLQFTGHKPKRSTEK